MTLLILPLILEMTGTLMVNAFRSASLRTAKLEIKHSKISKVGRKSIESLLQYSKEEADAPTKTTVAKASAD